MVLTGNQTNAFFTSPVQMGVPADTYDQLQVEGITTVDDLAEFDSDAFKQITDSLRRPGGRIPDPAPNADDGATIPTPAFVIGAKSLLRLKAAAKLVRYYQTVNRGITPGNMQWNPIVKNFLHHWKVLEDRKAETAPEVPKITKSLPIVKWTEAFRDFLQRVCGVRTIPLAYVTRPNVDVDAAPHHVAGQPFGLPHESVEDELIARAQHTHALFREDNSQVYYFLEEATRTTSYAASIKPFQRRKNGRGAWLALIQQYAGEDKWRAELKHQDDLLHTRQWKGSTNFSLEKFVAQHRNAFVSMSQCAEHVTYQLPNENTRVTFLLDAIDCNHAPLQAAMALVRNDTGPDGKLNNFEDTASFLLPHDPVATQRERSPHGKRPSAQISDTSSVNFKTHKASVGKTGVSLRFHTMNEYKALSSEQKEELKEYRDNREQRGESRKLRSFQGSAGSAAKDSKKDSFSNKKIKSLISSAVAKHIKDTDKQEASAKSEDETMRAYIVSLLEGTVTAPANKPAKPKANVSTTIVLPPAPPPAVSLQAIMKAAKRC